MHHRQCKLLLITLWNILQRTDGFYKFALQWSATGTFSTLLCKYRFLFIFIVKIILLEINKCWTHNMISSVVAKSVIYPSLNFTPRTFHSCPTLAALCLSGCICFSSLWRSESVPSPTRAARARTSYPVSPLFFFSPFILPCMAIVLKICKIERVPGSFPPCLL